MRVAIVTPTPPGSHRGSRITAVRWAGHLADLGHEVTLRQGAPADPVDLLVLADAAATPEAGAAYRAAHPGGLIAAAVADPRLIRPDLLERALAGSDSAITFHSTGTSELPAELQGKARVVPVSAASPVRAGSMAAGEDRAFQICVLDHLSPGKDPVRAAYAVRRYPPESRLQIVHAGAAVSRDAAEEARDEQGRNPRYRWLGDLPPALTRDLLVRSHVLVAVSPREGRLNVLAEALSAGVPIVAARGPGSTALLGEDYPGLVAPGNTAALTDLLLRAEFEPECYGSLLAGVTARRALVDPALERDAWKRLIEAVAG